MLMRTKLRLSKVGRRKAEALFDFTPVGKALLHCGVFRIIAFAATSERAQCEMQIRRWHPLSWVIMSVIEVTGFSKICLDFGIRQAFQELGSSFSTRKRPMRIVQEDLQ